MSDIPFKGKHLCIQKLLISIISLTKNLQFCSNQTSMFTLAMFLMTKSLNISTSEVNSQSSNTTSIKFSDMEPRGPLL